MAGSYPDTPNHRIAYDSDGTIALRLNNTASGIEATYSSGNLASMNSDVGSLEIGDATYESDKYIVFLFPLAMDITDVHFYGYAAVGPIYDPSLVQYSQDTTNGVDGAWNTVTGVVKASSSIVDIRSPSSLSPSANSAKGLRFRMNSGSIAGSAYARIHLYGGPSSTSNRLDFWDPTLDQAIAPAHFDWGDTARGSVDTLTYRIKNQSASLTAQSIVVSTEMLRTSTPDLVSMFEHSTDGTNFSSTINIGSLAPGAISGTLHVRKTLTSDAPLSLWWPRFKAAPGSWT